MDIDARWCVGRRLLAGLAVVVVLTGCGGSGDLTSSSGPSSAMPATVQPSPAALATSAHPSPSVLQASAVKELKPLAVASWLTADAAYLRLGPDRQADLWVRFTNTTKSAYGFVTMNAALFSPSEPIGEPVAAASVNPQGMTPSGAHGWLKATLPMNESDFAVVNSVGLTEVEPPIPSTGGKASYSASNVAAVRRPYGSVDVSGTLDGKLTGLAAFSGLGAFLEFVVLDPSGAPLGNFDTRVKGTTKFDHTPFSGTSSLIAPGDIGTVEVYTFP